MSEYSRRLWRLAELRHRSAGPTADRDRRLRTAPLREQTADPGRSQEQTADPGRSQAPAAGPRRKTLLLMESQRAAESRLRATSETRLQAASETRLQATSETRLQAASETRLHAEEESWRQRDEATRYRAPAKSRPQPSVESQS